MPPDPVVHIAGSILSARSDASRFGRITQALRGSVCRKVFGHARGGPTPANRYLLGVLLASIGVLTQGGASEKAGFPDDDVEARVARVNEGDLRFLSEPPEKPVHHHQNRIEIGPVSLETGWVQLSQCHRNLDPVPATEIVYRPERIRDLRIVGVEGVGASWVEGASVQLGDVNQGASLCVAAESRALEPLPGGGYSLRNGPYMRRFLDGFYPMRVSLDIHYPADRMRLIRFDPPAQPGYRVETEPGRIKSDGWFEGMLYTRFDFCPPAQEDCLGQR